MKRFVFFSIFLLTAATLFSQEQAGAGAAQQAASARNVYAVVVGVSKYENEGIKSLDFAHRDAEIFAEYLKSKSGGSVPEENIVLLQNEKATDAAIFNALQNLKDLCKPNDLVYFYFSGHGDMESITGDGYLLPYNSPRSNYNYNTISIDNLNKEANILSTNNKAKVILITDACHSGTLAGSSKNGTFLAADKLRQAKANEIRITSSDKNQLSNEDAQWGDGRGVFSYYFIKGLSREADKNADGFVTVKEMKAYLDSTFSKDIVLAGKPNKQNPVIIPVDNFALSKVDSSSTFGLETVSSLSSRGDEDEASLSPVPKPASAYFFELLEKLNVESVFDFKKLNSLPEAEIPFAFISLLPESIKEEIGIEKISELENKLKADSFALQLFKGKLTVLLSDRGQKIINLYLDGDEAELERRRYYNIESSGYDVYPDMFAVAFKLTKPDDENRRKLEIKKHYFAGVAARLKIFLAEDPKKLVEEAIAEQLKAYELDENTAFVNNELGILFKAKKEYATAEKYLLKASQLADTWALPWANLVGLYATTKEYQKGAAAYESAFNLQPNFQGTYVNGGLLYEKQNNFLYAEELFRKSIKLNTRHYLPFERLGFVYMNITQYALADSFFNEADKRKKGYQFHLADEDADGVTDQFDQTKMVSLCMIDSAHATKSGAMGNFALAIEAYKRGNLVKAEEKFKKVVSLDKANPLAFHYLGKILFSLRRLKEGEVFLKLAVKYSLDSTRFNLYTDSAGKRLPVIASKKCIIQGFKEAYYPKIEDYYLLAGLYKNWNHFTEAEQGYRNIIRMAPKSIDGYYFLWNMLEKIGRFNDAENVIRSYAVINKSQGERELCSFNKRMISRFSEDGNMYYKAGLLLYHIAASSPDGFPQDRIIAVDDADINKTGKEGDDKRVPDVFENSIVSELLSIKEAITLANSIIFPRTEAIGYFLKADSLLFQDINALADVNYKIADLYVWLGVPEKASSHYKKSVDLQPENAGTRLKLVDTYATTNYLKGALEQLDSLNNRKEINFEKQLLLAKYCIHFGRYADAEHLLKDAQLYQPYKQPETDDLLGRLNLLNGNPKLALPFYQQYLAANPNNHSTLYTIACLNARMGNQAEAFKWLETAMAKGFRYGWVLKFDATWDEYRKLVKWEELQKKFPAKKYKS